MPCGSLARLADERIGGNADIVVSEPRKRMRRDDLDPLGDVTGPRER